MRASSNLGLMMPEVHLFHSNKKFKRYVRREFGSDCDVQDSEGQMTYCDSIAAVRMTYLGNDTSELTLLVHEAYHAAVAHMRYLGEDNPGEEIMAYLVQSIAHALFTAHYEWKVRKGLVE